ncbi:MAG: response regulator transcription factor [Candidatus Eisenbacteria bacterium]|nr:response regulator transcription factor [Candidatus Eisenbacteria bacterium]
MIPRLPGVPRNEPAPLVLVAVDDAKLADLLSFALQANHFRVWMAFDGEDALRAVIAERPQLVVADVHLSRRSGLELCSAIRRDAESGEVPIVLLAAKCDVDSRIEALAHGADDLVEKPFSPKELVARLNRMVARGRESQRQRRRSAELERDLGRLEADAGRARELASRERELRTLVGGVTEGLLRTLDLESLDARLLLEVVQRTGARSAALLTPSGATFRVSAVRGDLLERWERCVFARDAECLTLARTLARPLRREDLERSRDAAADAGAFAAHGVALFAVLAGAEGVEAVIVCEDRADGGGFAPAVLERLQALATLAAPVRATARRFRVQQDRALALLVAHAAGDPRRREALRETRDRLWPLAERAELSDAGRAQLALAWEIGPWGWIDAGREALAAFAEGDPTPRMRQLCELMARAAEVAEGRIEGDRGERLVAAGLRFQALRLGGRSAYEAWRTTAEWLGIIVDPDLREGFPEAFESAHD